MKKALLATLGVAALGIAFYAATTPASNHTYVDLGLTSGTLWATYNIGATKPEEFGDYFAWGETEPKKVFNWSTFKYAKVSGVWDRDSITKYNINGKYLVYDYVDSLITLLPEDDAATDNWGKEWRMPTIEEQSELVEECEYSWIEVNGVYGAKFIGKNGNSVFFPAAGSRDGSDVSGVGNYGNYWSSSIGDNDEYAACYFGFCEESAGWDSHGGSRYLGSPVRAVRAKK